MIKFGTDGWRAKIADEFTFENVRLVAASIAGYFKKGPILIGYDNRFLSEAYALEAARTVEAQGLECMLSKRSCPTPLISFAVKKMSAPGGIVITASHNPPEWNGMKVKDSFGGSAFPEATKEIERLLKDLKAVRTGDGSKIRRFDPEEGYEEHLKTFIDFNLVSSSNLYIVFDPMHGSSSGLLGQVLDKHGITVEEVNGNRDPLFGGSNPEPLPPNLVELTSVVKERALEKRDKIVLGIALDGDGDRIAAIDGSGHFINPHNIFSILLKHLVEHRKMKGDVVKTFNVTNIVSLMAKKYGLRLHETPIGFKHIAKLMLEGDVLIGGEESGGIGVKGHIPERDGTFIALMLIEALAKENRGAGDVLDSIMDEHGHFYYDRIDLHLEEERKLGALKRLKASPPEKFAGKSVRGTADLDGFKLTLEDESWILFRASGTEPLLRIYSEATSPGLLQRLLAAGEDFTR